MTVALVRALALVLAGLAATAVPLRAEDGTFAHFSDIHFNPFDPPLLAKFLAASDAATWQAKFGAITGQTVSHYGADTNHALLASALAAIAKTAAASDFAIVTGDLLAHRFEEQAGNALGVAETSEAARAFAVRTTLFVADALREALPGKPIIVSLGNNDSSCGDYRIDPGGAYLAATREAVRGLVGADLVAADFDDTYAAGGYYAARHPTVATTLIIVLNDILWSEEYENACGSPESGVAAADRMMAWLRASIAAAKGSGGRVWLVHHIPIGIDPYSTTRSKATTCPAKAVPFLKEPYASEYAKLLVEFAGVVEAGFAGHVHFDDYRLLVNAQSEAVGIEKIAPAISPIFGQNPGFHIFTYDLETGAPTDFSTFYLANLDAAVGGAAPDWRQEYAFTEAYGQPGYSAAAVKTVWQAVRQGGAAWDTYRHLYDVGRAELDAPTLPAYSCAVRYIDPQSFSACYCTG